MSALERSLAGMTFVMRANRGDANRRDRRSARTRVRSIARNLLALVASRFTRPAAARGMAAANFLAFEFGRISATSHDALVLAAW